MGLQWPTRHAGQGAGNNDSVKVADAGGLQFRKRNPGPILIEPAKLVVFSSLRACVRASKVLAIQPKIQAPLLIHYAGLDERINDGWPDYEAALKANGKEFTAHIYPDTNHGFHNDTTPRYDEAAAELAWDRTITFFNETLT